MSGMIAKEKTKTGIAFFVTLILCVTFSPASYSGQLCKVIAPKRLAKLHHFPVNIVVQLNQGAKPETFVASLNGDDITGKFAEMEGGLSALVGPEDGLKIDVGIDTHRKLNLLKIRVKGLEPGQDASIETFFFVEADRLMTVGPEGGTIQSLDKHVFIDIPQRALSSTVAIGIAKAPGSAHVGAAYELSPEGASFNEPLAVTMKYNPKSLRAGVREDDLFLIFGDAFPRKLENTRVDKTANTVSGTTVFLSKVSLSHYVKIGKKLEDVPRATDFRLPIGDDSDAFYSCGHNYHSPSGDDLGETFSLLHRSSYPDFDYPKITFNKNGMANQWYVVTAYGRTRCINPLLGPSRDEKCLYLGDGDIYSNGEDWTLLDHVSKHKGLPIHAITDGLVIFNGQGYGNTLVLAHRIPSGPIVSTYSYSGDKSPCAVGTVVRRGNVIGKVQVGGTGRPYVHFAIGKGSIIGVDSETGEIKVPSTWYMEWQQNSVYEKYYDPTDFLLNITGKYQWDFDVDGNVEGWRVKSAENDERIYPTEVRDGMLSLRSRSRGFQMVSYPLKIKAKRFDSIFIRMRSDASCGHGMVYFATDEEPQCSEDKAVRFALLPDSEFHQYRAFMADNPKWKGEIVGLRLVLQDLPIDKTTETVVDYIRLGRAYLSRTPDTGQTKCYDNGQETTCSAQNEPFYGQDAHYTVNAPSYEIKLIDGQEVVTDHVTGLTWQRHDDGIRRTWRQAKEYCENLSLAGYSDWRLPTKKELQSLLNYGFFRPAGDTAYFAYSHVPDDCNWSATTRVFLSVSAWKLSFWEGQATISGENNLNYVRAVRGRPLEFGHFVDNGDGTVTDTTSGLMWQQTETKAMDWEKALAYCENIDLGGYQDWRLPNIRELLSLVDDNGAAPSINATFFPGCRPQTYWSSTTHTGFPGFAWGVPFEGNDQALRASQKGRPNYVRAIRGGIEKQ
ncbi:MAG: DUF1566 domain-containing protein [Thermodesulfobacteriota bacterium]|nr:DUF1566 domain-containing protein [Thermodesulfobacteriota bacterium]